MRRPNVLLIYCDQLRWDAIGANDNPHVITPNIDRLASEGTNFDHYFVQNPLCMPSRASFLTGLYPSQLGITHMGVEVPQDTMTWASYLKPYGYTCANLGKLHFLNHANRDHRSPHPMYGFDQIEISDEPGVYEDAYRAWVRRNAPEQLDYLSVGLPPATAVWYNVMGIEDTIKHPQDGPREDFNGAVPFPGDEAYTHSAFVADRTIHFLEQQSPARPFLGIAGFYSPHAPWVVPQRFLDLYEPEQLPLPQYPEHTRGQRPTDMTDERLRSAKRGYYAMISEVDHYVGEILDTLESHGLDKNTIVIFTADHGEWLGDRYQFGKGYPGDDAATRVPLIIRWPQVNTQTGKTISHIVEAVDVLPTLLDAVGIQTPATIKGDSLYPALTGRDYQPRESALVEFAGWKNLRTEQYRYLIHADGTEYLWDAQSDPMCTVNHAAASEYHSVLQEHRHKLLQRILAAETPQPRTWPY